METNNKYQKQFQQILSQLNPEQKQAVEHIDGPALVLAGPGTGKTQLLAARIGYLLNHTDLQVEPSSILCLTFTEAGTVAMRKRLLKFIGPTAHQVPIYTFHAFCNEIIQGHLDYFGHRELEPISDLERVQLLHRLIDEIPPDNPLKRFRGDVYYETDRLANLFQSMKQEAWQPSDINEAVDAYLADLPNRSEYIYKRSNKKQGYQKGDVKQKKIRSEKKRMEKLRAAADLYPKYQKIMIEMNRFDYSDMILWVLNAFKKDEDFLRQYQEQYHYFLVDEYQDTSGAQNEILNALTSYWEKPDVFVVGDDDQAIYRFQGANVSNILHFYQRHHKHVKTYVLTGNYRSTQNILDTAGELIAENSERLIHEIENLEKNLEAKNDERAQKEVHPEIIEYPNPIQEETALVQKLKQLQESGENLNDVAVIYSHHKLADDLVKVLENKQIPYNISRKINILELPFIQKLINIIDYIRQEYDSPYSGDHLLFELLHYDFFNISPEDIAQLSLAIKNRKVNHRKWRSLIGDQDMLKKIGLEAPDKVFSVYERLSGWIHDLPNFTLQQFVEKIVNEGGILKLIQQSTDKLWLMQVLNSFFDFIKNESAKTPNITPKDLLELIDLMNQNYISLEINKAVHHKEGINLITAHSAKGLEFKHVFLIGCTKDNWEEAHKKVKRFYFKYPDTLTFSNLPAGDEIEERRRLFYVVMTRAKEHLTISYPASGQNEKPNTRSQFIDELIDRTGLEIQQPQLTEDDIFEYQATLLKESAPPSIELVEHEYLDALLENYKMSVTHLNKYLRCPLTFYFENVLRVPMAKNEHMAFGSAVHYALKRVFDDMKDDPDRHFPPEEQLMKYFYQALDRERDCFTDTAYERRKQHGEQILPLYYKHYKNKWNKVVVTEYPVYNIEAEGVPIRGKIDKIEFDGNKVNVVDYKTGKAHKGKRNLKRPNEKDEAGGDYWRQLVFYKLLIDLDKRKKWRMQSGEIDFIEKDQYKNQFVKPRLQITPEDVNMVKKQIKEVYDKIMRHEFYQGCGEDRCDWCNFVREHLSHHPFNKVTFQKVGKTAKPSGTDNKRSQKTSKSPDNKSKRKKSKNDQGQNLTLDL